ncbi:MAG: hypothetical protein GY716_10045 [bacterium]|nr:hypothetical protein [bacterium]
MSHSTKQTESGEWTVGSGRDVIHRAEHEICGAGLVPSAERARGVALAGQPAATRFDATTGHTPAAWVAHRVRTEENAADAVAAFELVAADAQEAVDHCLVAQRAVRALRAPGVCSVDPGLADSLQTVRLAEDADIEALLAVRVADHRPDAGVVLREAFDAAAQRLGRPVAAVSFHRIEGARHVLLATGSQIEPARARVDAWRAAGVECGLVCVALCRPAPIAEILPVLQSAESVVVLLSGQGSAAADALIAQLPHCRGTVRAMRLDDVEQALGFPEAQTRTPAGGGPSLTLGILPGSPAGAELLLEAIAPLADSTRSGVRPSRCRDDISALTVGGTAPEGNDAIEVLLVADASALRPEHFEAVADGASILLAGATGSESQGLHPETLEALAGRGLQARPVGATDGEDASPSPSRRWLTDRLREALAALRPELSAAHVRDGGDGAPADWDRALQHFYLTGSGAHSVADPPPSVGLRPGSAGPALGAHPMHEAFPDGDAPGPMTLLSLFARESDAWHRQCRGRLRDEIIELRERLGGVLSRDDERGPGGARPETLANRLGRSADELIDTSALSRNLPQTRGTSRLSAERVARIERATTIFESYLREEADEPAAFVLGTNAGDAWPGARSEAAAVGPEAALGLFDGLARRYTRLLRQVRIARLEVRSEYEAGQHDAATARFDWRNFTDEEIGAMPPVVVTGTTGEGISAILRSSYPVRLLISDGLAGHGDRAHRLQSAADSWSLGFRAVAFRDAYVLQSTLLRPAELKHGFARMIRSRRTALAVVAEPDWAGADPWLQLALADAGRRSFRFGYDPDAGATLAERLTLADEEQGLPGVTPADALAVHSGYRDQFRVIPAAAFSERQVDFTELFEAEGDADGSKLPFLWVDNGSDGPLRAVITWELARACHGLGELWRALRDMAGGSAEAEVPLPVAAAVDPTAAPADTRQAIERIVAGLLGS